jgi:hypothetical protein
VADDRDLPFRAGEGIYRLFQTPSGAIEMLAEVDLAGTTLHLKDVAVYPKGADQVRLGTRQVIELRNQLADEATELGFESLRISGVRYSGASPGKLVDIVIDLKR